MKQRRTVKVLAERMPPSYPEPQAMLDARDKQRAIEALTARVQTIVGRDDFYILKLYYMLGKSMEDIGKEIGVDKSTVSRHISAAIELCRTQVMGTYKDIMDLYTTKDQLPPTFGSAIPALPYEFAMNETSTPYKYRGETRYHTKCRVPEYLKNSFGSPCKCTMCFTDYGCSNCKRRKDN